MTPYRSPHHDTLSFNRHSEWRQECFVGKQENGNMTRSEESMTRMTSLTDSSGHLYPTPFQVYVCKKDSHLCKSSPFISSFLSRLCVAVSLSFARPFAPSKDVLRLSRATRPDRKPRHMKKTPTFVSAFSFISSFLSSRAASGQVLSAFVSLTSVFGMDTGDPHSCRHCFSERLFSQNHIEEVLKLFACLGVSKLRPRPISFMSLQALRLFHS